MFGLDITDNSSSCAQLGKIIRRQNMSGFRKEECKDQESIQSSTIPGPGHYMGK